jgi:hypothetical protein
MQCEETVSRDDWVALRVLPERAYAVCTELRRRDVGGVYLPQGLVRWREEGLVKLQPRFRVILLPAREAVPFALTGIANVELLPRKVPSAIISGLLWGELRGC